MKRNFLILIGLLSILILPGRVSADCMSVGPFDNFILQGDDTVILTSGGQALVKIDTNCTIYEKSRVRLLKNYICDGDDIMIDGSACNIVSLTSANED
jgi:hypothetical protein